MRRRRSPSEATAGAGMVNVWLNMAKLLIGLVYAYKQILSTQLGIDLLRLIVVVITLGSFQQTGGIATSTQGASRQRITDLADPFIIPFIPVSRDEYDHGHITVTGIFKSDGSGVWEKIDPREGDSAVSRGFAWPGESREQGRILVRGFVLTNLVAQTRLSSLRGPPGRPVIYKVLFRVRLHEKVDPSDNAHSLLTGTWPEKWGQPAPPSPPDDWGRESNNFVLVDYYSPPAERPIGPLTLVEGQWTKHPPELQDPLPNGGRRNKRLSFVALSRHPEVAGTPIQGTIEIDDAMGFRPSIRPVTMRYAPDDWRKNIYFLEVSEVLTNQTGGPHYVIQFVLEPNVPPRPIRAKAKEVGDQRVGFLLYYPSDRYTDKDEDGSRYQYFNLDKFVVDPDGVGRPEDMLRPLYVRLSQDVEGWRVIGGKSDPNGWRLRIPANYTIRPRAVVQLSLSDEVSRVGVDAVIIRQ